MLFNSYEFIFVFLPITLVAFFVLGKISRSLALAWLTLASLFFYAWWRPINVPIIGVSLFINYAIARGISRLNVEDRPSSVSKWLLLFGIVFNVLFLGYFKYTNFVQAAVNDLVGTHFIATQIILPLGISFITFQKIAFLIDVHARRVESFTPSNYCLFVLFFPQLIAGPIVHYREMMPQFQRNPCRFDGAGVAVGLTLFCFGLLKKVIFADGISYYVTPIYDLASKGGSISLFPAWTAAVGFTLQIYFDFSGYSDMAAGLARCFGIRLPLNFDSPLQARSIIDFWSRWHVTLTRFLTAYLYNPFVLWLTRRRMANGLPGLNGRNFNFSVFMQLLVVPTLLTMFVSGLWHGAGYLFILWGLLHGMYLTLNHAWRMTVPRFWPEIHKRLQRLQPVWFLLTLLSVVVAMVLFRAPTVPAAADILRGMVGLGGVELPSRIVERLGSMPMLHGVLSASDDMSAKDFLTINAWLIGLLFIALVMPNSLQILSRFEPVIGSPRPLNVSAALVRVMEWRPSLKWAVVVSLIAVVCMMRLGGKSEFLYWQF